MKNKIKRTIIASLLVSTLIPTLVSAKSFKAPDLVKQEGIKINRQLEVNRKSLDKPTQIKPYKVSVLGEYYEFDRNDPLLKDVTSQEYDGMEYKCDQNTSTKMQIWDGSDLYNPSIPIKSVEPRSVFLTSPKMYFTEAMGANEHNLAYFAPLYVELDNGVKVDMSAFSVKDTIAGTNGKKTNIWGRTVKRMIFQNRRNCFERLVINTNIQLPDSPPEEGIVFVSYVTGEMMDSNGNTNLK